MRLWGYSEIDSLIKERPTIKNGILVDTNILVSATYDLDMYNDESLGLIKCLISNSIPVFSNLNIRSEFLEIHRRILFSEAILDFERECSKSSLPLKLSNSLSVFRAKYERRLKDKPTDTPLKLSESEIKDFKFMLINVRGAKYDLWSEICKNHIGNKLINIWLGTIETLGLNFLSLSEKNQEKYLLLKPDWSNVVELMSGEGLSSSDAMIINIFHSSKFEIIASSDKDIALTIQRSNRYFKNCLTPDELKLSLQ